MSKLASGGVVRGAGIIPSVRSGCEWIIPLGSRSDVAEKSAREMMRRLVEAQPHASRIDVDEVMRRLTEGVERREQSE